MRVLVRVLVRVLLGLVGVKRHASREQRGVLLAVPITSTIVDTRHLPQAAVVAVVHLVHSPWDFDL